MDWAIGHRAGSDHDDQVLDEIMQSWVDADPVDAADWLTAHVGDPQADVALQTFSELILDRDPVTAVAWAGRISDAERRDDHLRELLGDWVLMDGEEAREEIRKLNLPENLFGGLGKGR